MLSKGASARVTVKVRTEPGIPLEPFAANKGMGRIALRRQGETVAAGAFHSPVPIGSGTDAT